MTFLKKKRTYELHISICIVILSLKNIEHLWGRHVVWDVNWIRFGRKRINIEISVIILYCKANLHEVFYTTIENILIDLANTLNYLFLSNKVSLIHFCNIYSRSVNPQPTSQEQPKRRSAFIVASPTYQTIYIFHIMIHHCHMYVHLQIVKILDEFDDLFNMRLKDI